MLTPILCGGAGPPELVNHSPIRPVKVRPQAVGPRVHEHVHVCVYWLAQAVQGVFRVCVCECWGRTLGDRDSFSVARL